MSKLNININHGEENLIPYNMIQYVAFTYLLLFLKPNYISF